MEKYNYREVMKADIRQWLQDNADEYADVPESDLYDYLCDTMWTDDEITGNASFYDSEYKCEEYLCHNFDLLFEALFEFGEFEADLIDKVHEVSNNGTFARWADCSIRCYLLSECLWQVLKELGYDV